MKRDEENNQVQTTSFRIIPEPDITSAIVKNAHATGDGAVKKTDELMPSEDNEETPNEADKTPY